MNTKSDTRYIGFFVVVGEISPMGSGDIFTVEEWEAAVTQGAFIDDDGFGCFANPDRKEEIVNIDILPSMFINSDPRYAAIRANVNWNHIVWFNR